MGNENDWGDDSPETPQILTPAPVPAPKATAPPVIPPKLPAPVVAVEAKPSAEEEPLPNGFAESVALLQKTEHEQEHLPLDKSWKANFIRLRDKLARIKKHIFAMQQGLDVVTIDADQRMRIEIARWNSVAARQSRLTELAERNPAVAAMLAQG